MQADVVITTLTIEQLKEAIKDAIAETPQQKEVDANELMDVEAACKLLRIAKRTLYIKTHRREIPFIKVGKRIYFVKGELIGYLKDKCKVAPTDVFAYVDRQLKKLKDTNK